MKLVDQEVQSIDIVPSTYIDTIKHIEKIGRICYQSDDKITDSSAEKFCKMLVEREHTAMIEHSWLVVKELDGPYFDLDDHRFLKRHWDVNGDTYLYGNWRAFLNSMMPFTGKSMHQLFKEMPYITEDFNLRIPLKVVEGEDIPKLIRAYSVIFKTDRAVTHEMVRHRPASFAQESQRYCAYRDELEFINQYHMEDMDAIDETFFHFHLREVENYYKSMLKEGFKPQEARAILPNCTSTQIAITADIEQWEWIFHLRTSKAAYPQIRRLMQTVKDEFVNRKYI